MFIGLVEWFKVVGIEDDDAEDESNDRLVVGVSAALVWLVVVVAAVVAVEFFDDEADEDENDDDDTEFVAREDIEARARSGCDLSCDKSNLGGVLGSAIMTLIDGDN